MHRLFAFRPHKPRNPLLRLGLGLLGVALLALFIVFGLFIGLGMLLFAAVRRLMRPHAPAAAAPVDPSVIEGEYQVVRKQPSLSLR
ncbi:hypothetical protein [Arenimonas sp.]|uniref:hypothetical protein n=1 Tax=Arenimonas sp. TaxID=1872635 RepID=UPI0039E46F37